MSFKIFERNVSEFKPKRGDRNYRLVYTELEKGPVKEYFADSSLSIYVRNQELINFLEKPYLIFPEKDHFLLIVPKWVPLQAGWLIQQTESYNVYRIDRYAVWAGLVPEEVRREFDFEPEFKTLKIVGDYLVGSEHELEDAWTTYREDLFRREKDKGIRIKSGRTFSLALKLVEDGIIPFSPRAIEVKDKWKIDYELRPYQQEALDFWLKHGFMVLIWPFGAGKTILSMGAIAKVSGKTLVVVRGVTLVGQWERMLKEHLKGPRIGVWYGARKEKGDVTVTTYESASAFKNETFDLMIIDEAHHLPATTYAQLAMFDTKYRLCLTGSPFREDGRTQLIYALGGLPYGQNWERLIAEGWIRKPPIYVHLTPAKFTILQQLLQTMKDRTLIYCDTIEIGKEASRLTGIPFVYGHHSMKHRFKMLEKHERLICSRIFDEGIDIPDLANMIELDFHYGSRRQEMQRTGRLMHSIYEGAEYHILMSPTEYENYQKRLFGLYAKGFDIKIIEGK